MPEIASDSSRMFTEKRQHRLAQRRFVEHDFEEFALRHRRRPDHPDHVARLAYNSVSNASMMARHHGTLRMSISCSISDGTSDAASRRRCVPIFIATARAPMLLQDLLGETLRHHAARRGIEHQRGGVRGGEPVVEPVEPEIGDRRHVDQNFRHHHEQDGEEQQLAGQADARGARRRLRLRWRDGSARWLGSRLPMIASTENSQPGDDAPHPRARQTWRETVDGCAFSDFRQRRIRQHDAGQCADIEPLRDRQRPHRDQFAGLRADDGGAQDRTFACW